MTKGPAAASGQNEFQSQSMSIMYASCLSGQESLSVT
jgi:hypothetical protein